MIIDMRVRAPYRSYKNSFCAQQDRIKKLAYERFKTPTPPSLESASMDDMLAEMTETGVTLAVVPVRRRNNLNNNEDAIKIMEDYPGKFVGVPCVDIFEGKEETLKIIDDYIVNGPCNVLMTEPGFSQKPLYADDERLYFVYEKCEKEGIPLMMAFGGFIGPDYSYCEPLLIDHVARDFPKLKICLSHGGWPFANEMCHVASNRRNVWVSPDLYLLQSAGWQSYVDAANCMLIDRIVYGSAYPIVDMRACLNHYKTLGFNEEAWKRVTYDNAAEFLGL